MIDRNCPICIRIYEPALIKNLCSDHRRYYHVTKCKDCHKIILSEYNQLCVPCMFSTPRRNDIVVRQGSKGQLGRHKARPSRWFRKPKFVMDVDGENAKEMGDD